MVERFLAEALVCGYLGPGEPVQWARLLAGCPTPVEPLSSGPRHAIAASSADLLESVGRDAFTWGRYVVRRDRPRDQRDAAHELGLAGFWVQGEEIVLHTDLLGLHDVFLREIDGTVYFCNRIQPLRELDGGRLTVDWDAWGASLAFTGFVADVTGFNEVRRLAFGERMVVDRSGLRRERDLPDWILAPECEQAPADTAEVLDALREVLPRRRRLARTAITLSGGWDSRLIAMGLAAGANRRPDAWSVTPDNGFEDDLEHARTVASALGLRHTIVPTHRDAWARNRERHLRRLEHATWLHTWLVPVARALRGSGRPVYDGLAGDILLRNLVVEDELLDLPTPTRRLEQLWRNLGAGRVSGDGWLAEPARAHWTETTRSWLQRKTDVWDGLPAEYTLRVMTLRTVRCIGASPRRMLAPEVPVRMPLADPVFVRAALRVPPHAKAGKAFYRRLLHELDPRVGPLPSTNDAPAAIVSQRRQSSLTRAAIRRLQGTILGDEVVCGLLDRPVLALLEQGKPEGVARRLHLLHWAESLADWRRVNAAHLVDTPTPF